MTSRGAAGRSRASFSLAELLVVQGRAEEAGPLLASARETFDRLGAAPWLDRVAGLQAPGGQATPLR